ncbi:MAG: hypothetical protein ACK4RK_10490 [Gemmataceae bacterium]
MNQMTRSQQFEEPLSHNDSFDAYETFWAVCESNAKADVVSEDQPILIDPLEADAYQQYWLLS